LKKDLEFGVQRTVVVQTREVTLPLTNLSAEIMAQFEEEFHRYHASFECMTTQIK
jgi:hypothetical protein